MKKIILAAFIAYLTLSNPLMATQHSIQKQENIECKIKKLTSLKLTGDKKDLNTQIEQRSGCCSWHKGVCGCSGGRARCCDGSLSPSCGCN